MGQSAGAPSASTAAGARAALGEARVEVELQGDKLGGAAVGREQLRAGVEARRDGVRPAPRGGRGEQQQAADGVELAPQVARACEAYCLGSELVLKRDAPTCNV
jgi:hypothetical protein